MKSKRRCAKYPRFRPQAIIMDMDGVIVDSMPYHFLAWYEALRPLGVRVSCFDVYCREGERWEKSLKSLLAAWGIRPSKDILKKIFLARGRIFKKYFKRFIFKGAKEFLKDLKKKGYILGLVTGTTFKGVSEILPSNLKTIFDCIVTGDQVKKGKPDPEPYLKAAKILGLNPKRCLVIENAPLGIESAKRAGMFCIALTTSLPKGYLRKADLIVDTLAKAAEVFRGFS